VRPTLARRARLAYLRTMTSAMTQTPEHRRRHRIEPGAVLADAPNLADGRRSCGRPLEEPRRRLACASQALIRESPLRRTGRSPHRRPHAARQPGHAREKVERYFAARADDASPLFLSYSRARRGQRLTVRGAEDVCTRLGIAHRVTKLHPHRFRHTAGTSCRRSWVTRASRRSSSATTGWDRSSATRR
jgi:hypothetical protein